MCLQCNTRALSILSAALLAEPLPANALSPTDDPHEYDDPAHVVKHLAWMARRAQHTLTQHAAGQHGATPHADRIDRDLERYLAGITTGHLIDLGQIAGYLGHLMDYVNECAYNVILQRAIQRDAHAIEFAKRLAQGGTGQAQANAVLALGRIMHGGMPAAMPDGIVPDARLN